MSGCDDICDMFKLHQDLQRPAHLPELPSGHLCSLRWSKSKGKVDNLQALGVCVPVTVLADGSRPSPRPFCTVFLKSRLKSVNFKRHKGGFDLSHYKVQEEDGKKKNTLTKSFFIQCFNTLFQRETNKKSMFSFHNVVQFCKMYIFSTQK